MAYEIEKRDGYHAVRVWGDTDQFELMQAVRDLSRSDPHKELPDVWLVAKESMVPFLDMPRVVHGLQRFFPSDMVDNRTAIVAGDVFHKAQIEIFRREAASLPLDIRIFLSEDEALDWVRRSR